MPRDSKPKPAIKVGTPHATNIIHLPQLVKCGRCKAIKPQEQFSAKQLATIRAVIRDCNFDPATATKKGLGPCHSCIGGGQTHEMSCFDCMKMKSKDDFSKAQRRNPDHAQCGECMQKRLATEPRNTDHADNDSDSSYESNPVEDEEDDEVLSEHQSNCGVPLEGSFINSHISSDGWYAAPRPGSTRGNGNTTITSFASSAVGQSYSKASLASSVTSESIRPPQVRISKSGWAKPPAGPSQAQPDHLNDSEDDQKHGGGFVDDDDDDDDDNEDL